MAYNPPSAGAGRYVLAGVALLAAAMLAFEVYLTRVYAILVWSYMAFIIVSVALLGIGGAGAFLAAGGVRLGGRKPERTMAACALAFGLTALVGTAAVGHFAADLHGSLISPGYHLAVILYYIVSATPFFFAGFAFALAFRVYAAQAHRVYFFDLVGAAAGAFAVVGAMNYIGGAGTLVFIGVLAAAAAAAFARLNGRYLAAAAVLATAGGAAAAGVPSLFRVKAAPQKFLPYLLGEAGGRVENTYWNALGRVDVLSRAEVKGGPPLGAFRGFSPSFAGPFPCTKWITIDGGAETPIIAFNGDRKTLAFLEYYLPALAYRLAPPGKVLIIGPGGGVDVLAALAFGAGSVDAVELNPAIVAVDREYYARFNGGIFRRPEVTLYNGEGRSFVRGADERYDLIQLSLVDTFTAAASGAHALSENYLYTVEAFRDYYRRLEPGGVITVTRNYFTFAHESLKLAVMFYDALSREGEGRPERCIAVFTNGLQANVIVKRGGFSNADVAALSALAAGKFEPLWLPGRPGRARAYERIYRNGKGSARLFIKGRPFGPAEMASLEGDARARGFHLLYSSDFLGGWNEFSAFFLAADKARFFANYFYDVRSPSDDRPFYFLTSKWRNLYLNAAVTAPPDFLEGTNFLLIPHAAQFFLLVALAEGALLSTLFILAPVYFFRRKGIRPPRKWASAAYFFLLGGGFMFIEIPLIQKFTLYLGHPVYAFAVGLASLLAASGVGSLLSVYFRPRPWLPFVFIIAAAVAFPSAADWLWATTLGWPFGLRLILAVAPLAPLGFFLGMPFPLGISTVATREPALIPWAWAANGCGSVVGPAAAVLLAATRGHNAVFLAAAGCYVLAVGSLLYFARAPSGRRLEAGAQPN